MPFRRRARERLQHRRVEVQPGGRRGDRARLACVDRLVACRVVGAGVAADVRWQRNLAMAVEPIDQRARARKRSRKKRSSRDTTLRCALPGSSSMAPGFGGWLARICTQASVGETMRSTSISTRPPVAFRAKTRALMTRVSLKTSRSPARSIRGMSANARSLQRARRRRAASGCRRGMRPEPARSVRAAVRTRSQRGCRRACGLQQHLQIQSAFMPAGGRGIARGRSMRSAFAT